MYLSNMLCKMECITERKDCVFAGKSCAVRGSLIAGMKTRRKISKWRYRKNHGHGLNQSSHLEHYFGLLSVYLKTGFKCWYCGCDMQLAFYGPIGKSLDAFTFDHRVPLSKGGSNLIENMVICCWKCNQDRSHE